MLQSHLPRKVPMRRCFLLDNTCPMRNLSDHEHSKLKRRRTLEIRPGSLATSVETAKPNTAILSRPRRHLAVQLRENLPFDLPPHRR